MRSEPVVVTGIGVILPGCDSADRLWKQLKEGDSQIGLHADPSEPSRQLPMGVVEDFDPSRYLGDFQPKHVARYHREQQMYLSSLMLARRHARLDLSAEDGERVGLFDGTSRGNFGYWYERIREEQSHTLRQIYGQNELVIGCPGQAVNLGAALLHVHGPVYTFNGTCSAGAIAIGHALRELESGRIDVAFGTGHDCPLLPPIFQMYKACELLAFGAGDPKATLRPYAGHSRNVFAEGAVTLVLERAEHARRRGARVIATLAAYEYGNYGTHPTDVDGTGKRPARVIDQALAAAGASVEEIRFVVGHGNAAPRSDRSELEYMRRVFGPRTAEVPLISVKPIYGHLMGGSSALSTAAAALMVQHQYIVPTLNVDRRRAAPGFNHQAGTGKEDPCGAGLVVNLGLGGQTTALVLRHFEGASA